jgi:hypothetical protein
LSQQELFHPNLVFTNGVIYGEDHSILHTGQLPTKSAEVDSRARVWEGDSVLLAAKEFGLMGDALL